MKNEILEKYGYLVDESMKNFDYYSCPVDNTPLDIIDADNGDLDDDIIAYLAGDINMSWDIGCSLSDFCSQIGFYDRHPEYIGKIF
jgi:hypothetical protein